MKITDEILQELEDHYDLQDEKEGGKVSAQHTGRIDPKRVEDKSERKRIKQDRMKRKNKFDMFVEVE